MDEAQCSSNALPPFLTKTYEMVDDYSTDSIVSWSPTDKSFVVWNPPEFSRDLLPRYFKHNNFSSFIRQLNTYGFRKIDSEKWEFANDDFIKGQPYLLRNIHRRKPVHSHSLQNLQGPSLSQLTESEKQGYKDDIERLTCEKELLNLELKGHKEEQQGVELQLQALMERLQHMEERHKNMLSSLAQISQKPFLALNFVPQLDLHDRKRRLPRKKYFYDDASIKDNQVGTSQILVRESLNADSLLAFNKDLLEQLESSLVFWENMVRDVGHLPVQQNSSLDIDESTSYAYSPAISYTQLHVDVGHKTSGIDMNSEPATSVVPEVAASEEQLAAPAANAPTGINDGFWEQFLTENPGSADPSEVQSERKDIDSRMNENKPIDHGRFWWNMMSVNNLTKQLGQPSSTERT